MPQRRLVCSGNSPRSVTHRISSAIGLLYALPLLLLIVPGVMIFEQAWGYDHHWVGFFVNVLTVDSLRKQTGPYSETVFLSVDGKEQWNLNGKSITPNEIPAALKALRGDRSNCFVFLDVDPNLPYAVAIHAIDLIEGTGFEVILQTPGTKKMRIP